MFLSLRTMKWCGVFLVVYFVEIVWSHAVSRRFLDITMELRSAQCGVPTEAIDWGSTSRKRVTGGKATTTKSFPWTIMIKKYGHSDVRCGGVILSQRLVLTAAHCFDHLNKNEMYLLTGVDDMDGMNLQQRMYHASDIVIHEHYDRGSLRNDIALLRISSSITYSDWAKPICFPSSEFTMLPGDLCVFAGYGDTQGVPPGRDRKLNFIQVPLVNSTICAQPDWLGTDFATVSDVSFCAGYHDGGPDACSGDSGGALVCARANDTSYYVYGISSWGKGCGERQMPGVYTKVVNFVDWVRTTSEAFN